MFNYLKLIQSVAPKETLTLHKGSCVRQRYKRSDCAHCFDVCPTGALAWQGGELRRDEKLCQSCLLCTAVCPMGALISDDVSFVAIIKKLKEVAAPVLGCTRQAETQGHARVPCLGLWANRDLLFSLSLAVGKPVQLDMTQCRSCHNVKVVAALETACAELPEEGAIKLVQHQEQLDFQPRQCDRREFFSLFRGSRDTAAQDPVEGIQIDKPPTNYRSQRLPVGRSLLLQFLKIYPERAGLLKPSYWPRVSFTDSCRACQSCTSICPTGALAKTDRSVVSPAFNQRKCVTCKLCEEFCKRGAIHIEQAGR